MLKITHIQVQLSPEARNGLRAEVELVLNRCLVIKGIQLYQGEMGHYLVFPRQTAHQLYKHYDVQAFNLRKQIQQLAVMEYLNILSKKLKKVG